MRKYATIWAVQSAIMLTIIVMLVCLRPKPIAAPPPTIAASIPQSPFKIFHPRTEKWGGWNEFDVHCESPTPIKVSSIMLNGKEEVLTDDLMPPTLCDGWTGESKSYYTKTKVTGPFFVVLKTDQGEYRIDGD